MAHFKTQHVAYRKTGLEWEILGDLGLRLHHKEEAKEAYQRCLDSPRYSVKPWAKLMETYADEGDIQRCVQTAIRVSAYQYADYTEMSVSYRSGFLISSVCFLRFFFFSTRHKSPVPSSSLAKSMDTQRSLSPCSAWVYQSPFSKLWIAIFSMANPSRLRDVISRILSLNTTCLVDFQVCSNKASF